MIRTYIEIGLIVLSGGLGWWGIASYNEARREEGRREILEAEFAELVEAFQQAANESRRAQAAAELEAARSDSIQAASEERIEEIRAERPAIRERVILAPDTASTREALEELEEGHEEEVQNLYDVIAAVEAERDAEHAGRIAALDAQFQAERALEVQLGLNRERGFIEKWGERLGWAVGGGLTVYAISKGDP